MPASVIPVSSEIGTKRVQFDRVANHPRARSVSSAARDEQRGRGQRTARPTTIGADPDGRTRAGSRAGSPFSCVSAASPDEHAGSRRSRRSGTARAPGAQGGVHGGEHQGGQQVLGHERARQLDQHRVDGGDRHRDQARRRCRTPRARRARSAPRSTVPSTRLRDARGLDRAVAAAVLPVDQVEGGEEVRVSRAGSRRVGPPEPPAPTGSARPRVVARVRDLAGRAPRYEPRIVDRPVASSARPRDQPQPRARAIKTPQRRRLVSGAGTAARLAASRRARRVSGCRRSRRRPSSRRRRRRSRSALATASCSALRGQVGRRPVPPNSRQVHGMIW